MTATAQDHDLLDSAGDEVVAHLQNLLRLDTRNPPGNEYLAAHYLRDDTAPETKEVFSEISEFFGRQLGK